MCLNIFIIPALKSGAKVYVPDHKHNVLQNYLFIFILHQLSMYVICWLLYLTAVIQRFAIRRVNWKAE